MTVLDSQDRPGVIQKPIDVVRAVSWDRNDSDTQVFDRGDVQDAAAEVLWGGTVDALAYVRRGGMSAAGRRGGVRPWVLTKQNVIK